jgi:hypothetical protein
MNLHPPVPANNPAKHLFLGLIGLFALAIAPAGLTAQSAAPSPGAPHPGTWTGILASSSCKPAEVLKDASVCFSGAPEAKPLLFDDTNGVVYTLEPQQSIVSRLGELVTVSGTLDGANIQAASVQALPIGLAVGQKAPDFSILDQFGQPQTLETLRGPKGTVLLFFRSADW